MSVQVASSTGFFGATIEEKTRSLLGWTDLDRPTVVPPPIMASAVAFFHSAPNCRSRKDIIGRRRKNGPYQMRRNSFCLTPPSSPNAGGCLRPSFCRSFDNCHSLPISPVSPNTPCTTEKCRPMRENEVFERLRQLVPVLPSDKNAYQTLIETVSNVIDLEHQLEQLSEKTESVRCKVLKRNTVQQRTLSNDQFPDDLMGVDVTAFKSLLSSPSSPISCISSDISTSSFRVLTVDTNFFMQTNKCD